jgi:hypothetical protein
VAAAFVAGPSLAHATTWCVKDPSCPAGGNSSQSTINGAAGAAANGDTILIGPGKFMESVTDGAKLLTYIGAGAASTVVQAPTPNATTFATGNGVVANLGIELGGGSAGTALFFGGTAINVAITAPQGMTGGTGVAIHGGSFEDGTISLPTGPGVTSLGVSSGPGAGGTVQDSTVTASTGIRDVINVARDRIFAAEGIKDDNASPGGGGDRQYVVDDALIDTTAAGSESGITLTAGSSSSGTAVDASLTIRHSTLIGDGGGGSTGVNVNAQASQSFVGAGVQISSTIVRGYATALSTTAAGSNAHGAAASIFDDYSDLNPALETSSNTGNPVGTGGVTDGTHNLNVDPGFVSTTTADPLAFQLVATSPLIDAGQPGLLGGESPLDLAGAPRVVADHRAAVPLSDIGAFEYQPHPPAVTSAAGPGTVAIGHPAAFTASGTDPDPGDQITFTWSFDDGSTAPGANVSHTFATAGEHSATVTATDLDGLSATATTHVLVVGPGKITNLQVKPSRFRPASSGASIAVAAGALVSYSDSAAATTTFTVQRKSGRHTFKTVGRFEHTDAAGSNHFRFTGRVSGHALAPGHYRLKAVPLDLAGQGASAVAQFSVRA